MSDPYATPPPSPSASGMPAEHRQWAMFAHLSALTGGLLTRPAGGWGCFIGPLVIWLIKKETMPFVDDQAKEALNFNITVAIIALVMSLLFGFFTLVTLGLGLIIVIPVVVAFVLAWLVMTIIAAIRSNDGQAYRYPVAIRFIR